VPRARSVSHATPVPLGQPEKAMGHESPIEPWLAPDNRAACGLRTDWLRRAKLMKTGGKENQKRCLHEAASRDRGTEGYNNPAQTRWAGQQEKIQPSQKCFFLDSFCRTNQGLLPLDHQAIFPAGTNAAGCRLQRCPRPSQWQAVPSRSPQPRS
jgi:hypothetical protein